MAHSLLKLMHSVLLHSNVQLVKGFLLQNEWQIHTPLPASPSTVTNQALCY